MELIHQIAIVYSVLMVLVGFAYLLFAYPDPDLSAMTVCMAFAPVTILAFFLWMLFIFLAEDF